MEQPTAWLGLEIGELEGRSTRSNVRWLVADGRVDSDAILAAAAGLRDDQRLILPVERRRGDEMLPLRSFSPMDLLLRPSEIEDMFPDLLEAQIEQLSRVTDGWLGPLVWLREHQEGRESTLAMLGDEPFLEVFRQQVLHKLDPPLLEAITDCALVTAIEIAVWRRFWIDRPARLAALERMIAEWGWLIHGANRELHLPRLLRQAVSDSLAPEATQREVFSRLGTAAYHLGYVERARHYLELAGDAPRLSRLQALGGASRVEDRQVNAAYPEVDRGDIGGVHRAGTTVGEGNEANSGATSSGPLGFRLKLLGQPVIQRIATDGEARELTWSLRRALQSVAYLALAPDRRATKDELIDAVWREVPEAAIRKNFHPTLSDARRTLGLREVFVYRQGLYTLNPGLDWWIDCEHFRGQVETGRQQLRQADELHQADDLERLGDAHQVADRQRALDVWLSAWKLYHGPLLAGLEAAWIQPLREALYRDYTELLRNIGELSARLGQRTQALDAYRSLLLEEPFEERIHLAVMELYARQGRRDLVRRQFVRMQDLLLNELGVEPLLETQERYHELMR
ncbi:MAG: BTAD domain-containing putative transcriptional regulator [Acidobacteriota bacterium]